MESEEGKMAEWCFIHRMEGHVEKSIKTAGYRNANENHFHLEKRHISPEKVIDKQIFGCIIKLHYL